MSKLDVAQSAKTLLPIAPPISSDTVAALNTIGGLIEMSELWTELLMVQIFPKAEVPDAKSRKAFQRRLLSQQAMSVLMVVWKDSDLVGDAEIGASGASRVGTHCAPINCHNLAKKMAADIDDVDRQEKKIQGIVKAAEAYGLIVREQVKATRQRALRGTALLHQLMIELHCEVQPICADIAAQDPGGL